MLLHLLVVGLAPFADAAPGHADVQVTAAPEQQQESSSRAIHDDCQFCRVLASGPIAACGFARFESAATHSIEVAIPSRSTPRPLGRISPLGSRAPPTV
jgi:hypothetical protein